MTATELAATLPGPEPLSMTRVTVDDDGPAPSDDRLSLGSDDRVVLIVDNDERFTDFAIEVAREHGWKGIVTSSGAAAVALAGEYDPDAITLDLRLPDVDGLRVLRRLKADLSTRHIPVQIISTDDAAERGAALGAWSILQKPIQSRDELDRALETLFAQAAAPVRDLLVVSERADELADLLACPDVRTTTVVAPADALAVLEGARFDCTVVDARGGSDAALEMIREAQRRVTGGSPPFVLYGPNGSWGDYPGGERLVWLAETSDALLDRTARLLHQRVAAMPSARAKVIEDLAKRSTVLAGRRALIVDDDVRNIFALTSVLETERMEILAAENGQTALELLQEAPDVDVVLMDIMMPGMDGYETMRAIRKLPQFRSLPIVAVTAKAMKGDRERTFEAGAWDYLSKPVEPDRMLSVLRAWLER